jgi:hypothetical protein
MKSYKRIFPKNGAQLFDGGLNSKYEKALIADNESPDCQNVIFNNGAVETRGGTTKLNTQAIATAVGDGLYTRRTTAGAETMIAFAAGSAWQLATTTFSTIGSAQSVFTAGVRVAAAQMENHIFFGNGYVTPYKWNGTDWTRHGVYPPTTTMTAATAATGNALTGAYRYKVAYVNSQSVESDVGPITGTFTAAAENIALTGIPVAPQSFGVSSRRIYRTENGGSTYKRLATIADNSTTSYDDAILDAALGAAAPTDQGVPPKYSAIIYHQSRMFMNDTDNPSMVWWTELNEPYTVKTTNFQIVGDATQDTVTGFGVYDNSLIIYCKRSTWIYYMQSTTTTDWRLVKAKSPYGSSSPFCILDYNNRQLSVAMQEGKLVGFSALRGDTAEPSATNLTISTAGGETKSDRIEPDVFDMIESMVGNFSGIVYKNKAYISVTKGAGNTTNNRVYCMDFSISRLNKEQRETWVPFTGWNAAQFTIYGGNLYYISSTATGFVYKHDPTIYGDDGSAIDSYFWTKEFSGYDEDVNLHKDFRFANILYDTSGDYFMNFYYRNDSDKGGGNLIQIDLDPGGSLWGSMIWGTDMWGGGSYQREERIFLGSSRGKRVQFKFTNQNTVNQKFKIHRLSFLYNVKGYR